MSLFILYCKQLLYFIWILLVSRKLSMHSKLRAGTRHALISPENPKLDSIHPKVPPDARPNFTLLYFPQSCPTCSSMQTTTSWVHITHMAEASQLIVFQLPIFIETWRKDSNMILLEDLTHFHYKILISTFNIITKFL